MHASPTPRDKKGGLAYWAARVLEECDKTEVDFAPDPVHDLRVAIRRCRSMADGFFSLDPDPAWKQMKKLGKSLFSALGDLRDTQVMTEWVDKLAPAEDPLGQVLRDSLHDKETAQKTAARDALQGFDRKRWSALNAHLARRSTRLPLEGLAFQHLALERWSEAHDLHRQALRNRSQVSYHQLRIGIKRFRYTLENFLPARHEKWARDLRDLQDALGEVHDLDVLRTMVRSHPEIAAGDRAIWQQRITAERDRRLKFYREKMVGPNSLWPLWRADLPHGETLERAVMTTFRAWASFYDPDSRGTQQVTRVALRLFDLLLVQGMPPGRESDRRILEAASVLAEIGRRKREDGHHKRSYRMILKLKAPQGWSDDDLQAAAWVARYHRGALPRSGQTAFTGVTAARRTQLLSLAGILRLANQLGSSLPGQLPPDLAEWQDGKLVIYASGTEALSPAAERLARARYLLEAACGVLVVIRSATPERRAVAPAQSRVRKMTATAS